MKILKGFKGEDILIDEEDWGRLSKFKWYVYTYPKTLPQIKRTLKVGNVYKTKFLWRDILDVPEGLIIDHKNHNRFDNRKENLRICTHADNMRNSRKLAKSNSQFKGVSWHKRDKLWQASIRIGGVNSKFLGLFKTELEAAKCYDEHALKHYGEFAVLNLGGQN